MGASMALNLQAGEHEVAVTTCGAMPRRRI
jgi:hypothetical protein